MIFADIERRQLHQRQSVGGSARLTFYAGVMERRSEPTKKKRPHFWGHPKEAREGGKVREGDACQLQQQSRHGDVEIV